MAKRWTDADDATLRRLYLGGADMLAICDKMERTLSSVMQRIQHHHPDLLHLRGLARSLSVRVVSDDPRNYRPKFFVPVSIEEDGDAVE